MITNLASNPIRLAFAGCKLLGQYLRFISKTGGKNVYLVRRSLRKEKKILGKTEQSTQIERKVLFAPQWSIEHLPSLPIK